MVGLIIGFFASIPFVSFIFGSTFYAFLGAANIFFLVFIPIIGIIRLASRLFFKKEKNSIISSSMGLFWVINLISFFFVGSYVARDFQTGNERVISVQEFNFEKDTIRLSLAKETGMDHWANFDGVKILDDDLVLNSIFVGFEKSKDDQFRIVQKHSARGRGTAQVEDYIEEINYQPTINENEIIFPADFLIEKGNLWRVQQVEMILQIPEGKSIRFGNNKRNRFHRYIDRNISDNSVKTPRVSWKREHTWTMQGDALVTKPKEKKVKETTNKDSQEK